jgi:hypothetical protein
MSTPPQTRGVMRGRVLPALRRRVAAPLGHGPSALNIPVPAASGVVPGTYITLISPFVAANRIDASLLDAVRDLVSRFEPFDFTLARVDRFPGVMFVAPEPAQPFVELVEAFLAQWPEHPPYAGAFDTVIPHLTVWYEKLRLRPWAPPGGEPPGLADEVARSLPIHARATHVDLLAMGPRWRWSRRASFPLGG